jgi:DNA modification methylase
MIDACYFGDVRDGLRSFIAAGVRAQTCVSSPPYWGLRDYGTAEWEGGSVRCDHIADYGPPLNKSTLTSAGIGATPDGAASKAHAKQFRDVCSKCGARRVDRQIGLEPTIGEYVQTMVEVFRLVRDVLADDGTLWLNLGDSYAANRGYQVPDSARCDVGNNHGSKIPDGLKPKDLCGIPWRVAFALQADGWYLRQDIIWSKPNPMPESVTDRCTKAHEYLFLLSKRERYYFDAAAIAEPCSPTSHGGSPRNAGSKQGALRQQRGGNLGDWDSAIGRNRRSVWTITTESYSEAHFATFPTALVEPCIAAGTSERGHCSACGKGWQRVTEREKTFQSGSGMSGNPITGKNGADMQGGGDTGDIRKGPTISTRTTGWQPTCQCNAESVPGVVLDPFMGSGTVAQVAQNLGRRWLGCELNPDYIKLQSKRAAQTGMAFA